MNTPRSKPPKRWKATGRRDAPVPELVTIGLAYHPMFTRVVGQIASLWPHIDDAMAHVFRELLGVDDDAPVRAVYRSIVSPQIRLRVMRNLLEESRINADKGGEFDDLLSEFDTLNDARSRYLHGLWSIHDGDRIFLSSLPLDEFATPTRREVGLDELEGVSQRMTALASRLRDFRRRQRERAADPEPPQESPELPDEAPR